MTAAKTESTQPLHDFLWNSTKGNMSKQLPGSKHSRSLDEDSLKLSKKRKEQGSSKEIKYWNLARRTPSQIPISILRPLPKSNLKLIPITFLVDTSNGIIVSKLMISPSRSQQILKRIRIKLSAIYRFKQAGLKRQAKDLLGFFSTVQQNYLKQEESEDCIDQPHSTIVEKTTIRN